MNDAFEKASWNHDLIFNLETGHQHCSLSYPYTLPALAVTQKIGKWDKYTDSFKTFLSLLNKTKQDSRSLKWEQNSLPSSQMEQGNPKAIIL